MTDGARVRGCAAGVTVAAGVTDGRRRTGSGSGAGSASDQPSGAAVAGRAAVRRWTGIGTPEVRLGTTAGRANTRPAGAAGPESWPRGCTMGGSGR